MFSTESHCTLWTFVEFFLSQVFKCFLDALNQIKVLYNINIANGKISRQFEFSNESLEFHFEQMIWNTLYSCGLCEFLCVSLVLWGSRMFLNKLNSWKACFLCDPECGSLKFGHYLLLRDLLQIRHVWDYFKQVSTRFPVWALIWNFRLLSWVNDLKHTLQL